MADDLPHLFVGDHVADREDTNGTMVVVGKSLLTAEKTEVKDGDTVADYNPEYSADAEVVECVFASRTDTTLDPDRSYAYPRPRLERVASTHDVDDVGNDLPIGELRELTEDWNELRHDLGESDDDYNRGLAEGARSAASELKQLIESHESEEGPPPTGP